MTAISTMMRCSYVLSLIELNIATCAVCMRIGMYNIQLHITTIIICILELQYDVCVEAQSSMEVNETIHTLNVGREQPLFK